MSTATTSELTQRPAPHYRIDMNRTEKLIFLPGAGGDPAFWSPVSERISHPRHRKLFGWPGFGVVAPDPKITGMDDLISMVTDEIDHPCALIAQSMGGVVAIQAALRKPELITHLILTATSGGIDTSSLHAEDWRPSFMKANPTLPRWFSDYHADLSDAIAAIRTPTLLLWGDADPISPVAVGMRLKELLPASRLHVIAGGGHDLANRFAKQVAPLIEEHLKR